MPVYYTSYLDIIISFVNVIKETKLISITEAKVLAK